MTTPKSIALNIDTATDLAVLLETIGPGIAYEPASHDAAGYASELRGAIKHAHACSPSTLTPLTTEPWTVKLPPSDHESGCVGNGLGAANDPAAVAKAQDDLEAKGQRDA